MKRICLLSIFIICLLSGGYEIFFSPVSAQQSAAAFTRNDAVAKLQQRLERGELKLEYTEPQGYLQSVLKLLDVPVSSQTLVFSKTSLQSNHISPSNPRAIYFNDHVYVGWIRGAELIEITAFDPKLGADLYILEQKKSDAPRFENGQGCFGCHLSGNTRFVTGPLMRSVYTASNGSGFGELRSYITDHSSPFAERWGGWYVTGTHGAMTHLGNMFFSGETKLDDPEALTGGNLTSLDKKVDLKNYLSSHSDIVALMTMSHQTQGQNLIVWLGQETQMALREQESRGSVKTNFDAWPVNNKFRVTYAVDELLKYLLFIDETKLDSPITGTSNFAQEFSALGIKDKQGRSLRDFDLTRRLFRYPCSYLIYTEAFDGIPQPALSIFYRKLYRILTDREKDAAFASLKSEDRRAILEILTETKKNLPDYFYTTRQNTD